MKTSYSDHGSRRPKLVRDILQRLFAGEYAAGQRMRVEHLAVEFQVSATPVREALVELAGIGVVELQPNRGAVLRPFGPRELRELVQVRRILECEATRCACGRLAPFELQSLDTELSRLIAAKRTPQWSETTRFLDSQLHELIASRCGSERLAHEINRYAVLYRALRDARHQRRTARSNYANMDENAEHLAIVRALAAGEADAAASAMAIHIRQSAAALEQDLFAAEEIARDTADLFLSPPVRKDESRSRMVNPLMSQET